MKKIILTVAAVFAFGFANAQEEKVTTEGGFAQGNVFLSGAVGFSSTSMGDAEANTLTFSPKVGYFVTDNIAVGISLGLETAKEEVPGSEDKMTEFSVGAFGRYYFTPASKFSVFGQLGFNVTNTKIESTEDFGGVSVTAEAKSNGFNLGLQPGVSYFVSNNFAIEATFGNLGYETSKPDMDGAESTDTFEFGVDMRAITFGLIYKF